MPPARVGEPGPVRHDGQRRRFAPRPAPPPTGVACTDSHGMWAWLPPVGSSTRPCPIRRGPPQRGRVEPGSLSGSAAAPPAAATVRQRQDDARDQPDAAVATHGHDRGGASHQVRGPNLVLLTWLASQGYVGEIAGRVTRMSSTAAPAPARMRVDHISKSFEAVRALRDVSFDLAPGEIHALVGENGAGKSTLVGIITGLLRPDEGNLRLDGKPVEFRNPLMARAAGVAAVYQDPHLFPHLSVAENIFTGQYQTRFGAVDRQRMNADAKALLGRLGFEMDVDALVAGLTVAEAQFVEIARALVTDLRLLIL